MAELGAGIAGGTMPADARAAAAAALRARVTGLPATPGSLPGGPATWRPAGLCGGRGAELERAAARARARRVPSSKNARRRRACAIRDLPLHSGRSAAASFAFDWGAGAPLECCVSVSPWRERTPLASSARSSSSKSLTSSAAISPLGPSASMRTNTLQPRTLSRSIAAMLQARRGRRGRDHGHGSMFSAPPAWGLRQ